MRDIVIIAEEQLKTYEKLSKKVSTELIETIKQLDESRLKLETSTERANMALDNRVPVAYILRTGHDTKIVETKPDCEIDYWKPLYE